MRRTLKYLAGAAVTAAVAGMATMSYAASHDTVTKTETAQTKTAQTKTKTETAQTQAASAGTDRVSTSAATRTPKPRFVTPGERVTAAPGFRLWLTAEGKHWTTPSTPEPQFRSVVDGNIDPNTPGVSVQSETSDTHAHLSGLYYGGKGTASTVEIETASGTVHGKLIELPGNPGWGAWYATTDIEPTNSDTPGSAPEVTVHDTDGGIYARLTPP